MHPPSHRYDRLLVVFSDIEMGAGGLTDDFPHSAFLGDLITGYADRPQDVDIIFNGDTFDLLKTSLNGKYPHHVDVDIAIGKFMRIGAAHPKFFSSLRSFLSSGPGARRVHFMLGNHDPELLFPEVQALISTLLGGHPQVNFPGYELDIGDVHIEHGDQDDPIFAVDKKNPIIEHDGKRILNLPWASVALLEAVMPMVPALCFLDRLKPRKRVFELMPELSDLLTQVYWKYWTQDYWTGWFYGNDPMKKVSWSMFRELIYRFGSRDPEFIGSRDSFERLMKESDRYRVYLIGHGHETSWRSFGDRKVLRTGCFRNEYMMTPDGESFWPIPKVYAEVYLNRGRSVRSRLLEVEGPADPPGYVPNSVFDLRPQIRALLGTDTDVSQIREEAEKQIEREGDRGTQVR